jgi:hypothetical protein
VLNHAKIVGSVERGDIPPERCVSVLWGLGSGDTGVGIGSEARGCDTCGRVRARCCCGNCREPRLFWFRKEALGFLGA